MKRLIYYFWFNNKFYNSTRRFHLVSFRVPVPHDTKLLDGFGTFHDFIWDFDNNMKKANLYNNHYLRRKRAYGFKGIRRTISFDKLMLIYLKLKIEDVSSKFIRIFGPGRELDKSSYEFMLELKALSFTSRFPISVNLTQFSRWDWYLFNLGLVEARRGTGCIVLI